MIIAQSKLTTQGQISIPAEVRRRLGIGPGSVVEWDEDDGNIVVRKAGRFSSQDLNLALFTVAPTPKTTSELKDGIRRHIRKRHARD